MTPARLASALAPHGLFDMGHTDRHLLIGADAGWWDVFVNSDEYLNGTPDPADSWSKRVIGMLARQSGATAIFPSDGPPYPPFIAWALDTGRFWQSPTGMLVHDRAGLMISIRGALEFDGALDTEPPGQNPCDLCTAKPCILACPVDALSASHGYDVPKCKAFLDTDQGAQCMTAGCHVRRACPISQSFARPDAQSAFHMRAFH